MTERHALVLGAGLAGAAVCAALARRGWRLDLIDAADGPARGASALPVGMLSPHVTRAPTPLSRLSDLGVADTRKELERLVPEGSGWQACDVENRGHAPGRWTAALVRPAALVDAWLGEATQLAGLQTRWNTRVSQLRFDPANRIWQALDDTGALVARASTVVVAAAHGSLALLQQGAGQTAESLPLRPVQGQMSLGALDGEPLAARPQRDNGVFVPVYEDRGLPPRWPSRIWTMGSTYERGASHCDTRNQAHLRNLESLRALCPLAAERMEQALNRGELLGWAQVRCASLDRLPLMGLIPHLDALHTRVQEAGARRGRMPLSEVPRWPGLFSLTALGSRGLTLAHWCAQQLARQMEGERPQWPLEHQDLLDALDPARFAWRLARRQPPPLRTT